MSAVFAGALITAMTWFVEGQRRRSASGVDGRAGSTGAFLALAHLNHVIVVTIELIFGIRYGAHIPWSFVRRQLLPRRGREHGRRHRARDAEPLHPGERAATRFCLNRGHGLAAQADRRRPVVRDLPPRRAAGLLRRRPPPVHAARAARERAAERRRGRRRGGRALGREGRAVERDLVRAVARAAAGPDRRARRRRPRGDAERDGRPRRRPGARSTR